MTDTGFEAVVVTVVVAGGAALMWRTGGVDLPDLAAVGVAGWLVVALVVLAAAGLIVGLINRRWL